MKALNAIYWEIRMELISTIRYRFDILSDVVVYSVLLVFFLLSGTGKSFGDSYHYKSYQTLLVAGYIAWMYAVTAVSSISRIVTDELKQGTFYRKYNADYPMQFLLFGRMAATLLRQSIVLLVLLIVARVAGGIAIGFHPALILAIGIGTLGMYGLGLIVAGFVLYYKKTGALLLVIQLCLLFVTDTLPTSKAVSTVTGIIPLTACNRLIRQILAGGSTTACIAHFGLLLLLSAIFLLTGILVFSTFLHRARQKGNLLFY